MYFKKNAFVTLEITKPDGTTIKIASRDIKLEHIQQLVTHSEEPEQSN